MGSHDEDYGKIQLSCTFISNHNQNYNWKSLQKIILNKSEQQFSLIMDVFKKQNRYYCSCGQKYFCDIMFSLQPIGNSLFSQLENVKLMVLFKSLSDNEYLFDLKKSSNNTLASNKKTIEIHLTYNEEYNIDIEIFYLKNVQSLLIKDFTRLLIDEENTDFEIVAKDSVFNVHKCILSLRSTVFHRMMNTDMIEKNTNKIKLQEWDSSIIKELLYYMYTGSCDIKIVPHDLFRLSHYLEIRELPSLCIYYLKSNINEQTIIQTLELTDETQYNLEDLKQLADEFVASNQLLLSKNLAYLEYLCDTLAIDRLIYFLRFSKEYKIEGMLSQGIAFVRLNYKLILENNEYKAFFLNNSDLLMRAFKSLWEDYETCNLSSDKKNEE